MKREQSKMQVCFEKFACKKVNVSDFLRHKWFQLVKICEVD